MFAGAARAAVFSNPAVIRRVQAEFIPVALKAALVNNPPGGPEGQLYREIGRSKPAPQGICVVNSAGKVLAWALMFDDDPSVLAFLDHASKRFTRYPDAKQPVPAERYQKFPSARLEDVEDTGKAMPILGPHPEGTSCPARPRLRLGTVIARVFGRALGKDGKPLADTRRQEHYVEDRFHLLVEMQEQLAKATAEASAQRFRLPEPLARLLVSHAYLGQLDVNPVAAPGGQGDLKRCEFWGQQSATAAGPIRIRVEGHSEAAGVSSPGPGSDGRLWEHQVRLTWEGWIEMDGNRVRRLRLLASGSERLRWGNGRQGLWGEADVTHLPGGHPIDLACAVRYGVLGEPAAADQVSADAPPRIAGLPVAPVPDEARRQLADVLGPAFLIFRDKVQRELHLSAEQKEKIQDHLAVTIQDAVAFFQRLDGAKPDEREKELHPYRRKAEDKLVSFLREGLKPDQFGRLYQLILQREGPFALLNPDIARELKVTDHQHQQFLGIVREMETKLQPLLREAQAQGNHEEIRPKALKVRAAYAHRLETALTDSQKKQWQKMLGQPFDLGD